MLSSKGVDINFYLNSPYQDYDELAEDLENIIAVDLMNIHHIQV